MNNFIKKGFVSLLSLSVLCPVSALTKTESVFSNLNTDGSINKTTVTNHICSKDKDDKITPLSVENNFYKNNRQLIKSEKIRHEKSKELPEPRETIIDYEDTEYYDYDEDLDNKKEDDLSFNGLGHFLY